MKRFRLGASELEVSAVALGCMRINQLSVSEAARLIATAQENGINFFDHADIYGGGTCEEHFAKAVNMSPAVRETMILQTKCGICKGYFDFSKDHILESVDGSLKRLHTDYIDVLLLHRPDTLMEPEEVAEAFDRLHESGKVRYFGVSNQNPMQIRLLSRYVNQRLIANQLQIGPMNTGMLDCGLNVNMSNPASVNHDGSVLEFCRLHDITIQPWSPFQFGFFEGVYLDNPRFPELNAVIDRLAAEKGVSNTAIVMAWLLRHPAQMQPIAGTTNADRLAAMCRGSDITLTRPEWYEIYRAAGNILP